MIGKMDLPPGRIEKMGGLPGVDRVAGNQRRNEALLDRLKRGVEFSTTVQEGDKRKTAKGHWMTFTGGRWL